MATANTYLTVPEMAADIGVSDDKVRQWCRAGRVDGAINVGDPGRRERWKAPRDGWERFKESRRARFLAPVQTGRKKRIGYQLRYAPQGFRV